MERLVYGQDSAFLVTAFSFLLICFLVYLLIKKFNTLNSTILIAISIILGGGISNLIDRLFRGYVIDYIDINNIFEYPVFNLADIFIVCGVILIVISIITSTIKEQEK